MKIGDQKSTIQLLVEENEKLRLTVASKDREIVELQRISKKQRIDNGYLPSKTTIEMSNFFQEQSPSSSPSLEEGENEEIHDDIVNENVDGYSSPSSVDEDIISLSTKRKKRKKRSLERIKRSREFEVHFPSIQTLKQNQDVMEDEMRIISENDDESYIKYHKLLIRDMKDIKRLPQMKDLSLNHHFTSTLTPLFSPLCQSKGIYNKLGMENNCDFIDGGSDWLMMKIFSIIKKCILNEIKQSCFNLNPLDSKGRVNNSSIILSPFLWEVNKNDWTLLIDEIIKFYDEFKEISNKSEQLQFLKTTTQKQLQKMRKRDTSSKLHQKSTKSLLNLEQNVIENLENVILEVVYFLNEEEEKSRELLTNQRWKVSPFSLFRNRHENNMIKPNPLFPMNSLNGSHVEDIPIQQIGQEEEMEDEEKMIEEEELDEIDQLLEDDAFDQMWSDEESEKNDNSDDMEDDEEKLDKKDILIKDEKEDESESSENEDDDEEDEILSTNNEEEESSSLKFGYTEEERGVIRALNLYYVLLTFYIRILYQNNQAMRNEKVIRLCLQLHSKISTTTIKFSSHTTSNKSNLSSRDKKYSMLFIRVLNQILLSEMSNIKTNENRDDSMNNEMLLQIIQYNSSYTESQQSINHQEEEEEKYGVNI